MFLAQLAAVCDDSHFRRVALGALRHAQSQTARIAPAERLGLYSGTIGIGLALVTAGEALRADALYECGIAIIRDACASATGLEPLDMISGSAGAIRALLFVDAATGSQSSLAENILGAGIWEGNSLAWPSVRASGKYLGPKPLTGLSHGAAGIGLALLEVGARTGRLDLREAGEAAFRYEDELFSAQHQNWPDLRGSGAGSNKSSNPSYGLAWCHGAPGIGLTRLRAARLFPDMQSWRAGADAAVGVCQRQLASLLTDPTYDTTLCHGIAGLLELLQTASADWQETKLEADVSEAWDVLLSRHAIACNWPSRLKSPSLMTGLAGVGYALLRRARPSQVVSVLLVAPLHETLA